jgi:hypothetical protein
VREWPKLVSQPIFVITSLLLNCAVGVNIDCSDYVKRGLMDDSDKIDRNWATWSIFTSVRRSWSYINDKTHLS